MVFNGVLFPIGTPRITMPFKATETKWYSPEKPHRGVDLAPFPGSLGQPMRMPLHGRVVYAGERNAYAGKEMVTEHVAPFNFGATSLSGFVVTIAKGETFWLRSCHHHDLMFGPDINVEAGRVIAKIGNTGLYTTGPHIHLELHKGQGYPGLHLNPMDFFVAAIPGLRDSLIHPW